MRTKKPPHPSRLNPLDLALLTCAHARLESAQARLLASRIAIELREIQHKVAMGTLRDEMAAHENQVRIETEQGQQLGERLARDYDVNLKKAAISPETGEITMDTQET